MPSYLTLLFVGYLRRGDDEAGKRQLQRRQQEEEKEMHWRQQLLCGNGDKLL